MIFDGSVCWVDGCVCGFNMRLFVDLVGLCVGFASLLVGDRFDGVRRMRSSLDVNQVL